VLIQSSILYLQEDFNQLRYFVFSIEVNFMVDDFRLSEVITSFSSLESIKEDGFLFIICQDLYFIHINQNSNSFPPYVQEIKHNMNNSKELFSDLNELDKNWLILHYAFYHNQPCYLLYSENPSLINPESVREELKAKYSFAPLRTFFYSNPDPLLIIAGLANQIYHWNIEHKYCGRCATPFEYHRQEFAKMCPKCGNIQFPQISPAIIVSIEKEGKILLAHNKRFGGKFFSILAGFVSVGETLEETIMREVYEEVGIRVKNIRYIGSQPWPFPNSLMIGFQAEWESGEIKCDDIEINSADWFSIEDLEKVELPSNVSISRHLIDLFHTQHKK
jgi:NAD+ diphosphatase